MTSVSILHKDESRNIYKKFLWGWKMSPFHKFLHVLFSRMEKTGRLTVLNYWGYVKIKETGWENVARETKIQQHTVVCSPLEKSISLKEDEIIGLRNVHNMEKYSLQINGYMQVIRIIKWCIISFCLLHENKL